MDNEITNSYEFAMELSFVFNFSDNKSVQRKLVEFNSFVWDLVGKGYLFVLKEMDILINDVGGIQQKGRGHAIQYLS